MKVKDLPLRNLFEKLRNVGFVLGVDDYDLLLRALMGGFGVSATKPEMALKQLCETLWVKSKADRPLFNRCFEDCISESRPELRVIEPSAPPVGPSDLPEPIPSLTPSESPDLESTPLESTHLEPTDVESTPLELSETDADFPVGVPSEIADEVRVKKSPEREWAENRRGLFQFGDFLPVSEREMKQT